MHTAPHQQISSTQDLLRAAAEFRQWVETTAPGATVFLCGGLALSLYGNPRQTQDADLAIDLSRTRRANGRAFDTNALKQIAGESPFFSVGPKVYWILNANTPSQKLIQVDFVDAQLFWHPFSSTQMIGGIPGLPVPVMNLPTLLVGKMKSALERSQTDRVERITKVANDVNDFLFALGKCTQQRLILTTLHIQHLGASEQAAFEVMKAFFQLKASLQQPRWSETTFASNYQSQWVQLITRSQLPELFSTACNY
ncbi:unnamed protein product [Somion occarium]|uniref:Nucleotidyltransferase n=1 Tax=Somion occarium TaxID=3059160 RepID=A0ABP1DH80_9APHY